MAFTYTSATLDSFRKKRGKNSIAPGGTDSPSNMLPSTSTTSTPTTNTSPTSSGTALPQDTTAKTTLQNTGYTSPTGTLPQQGMTLPQGTTQPTSTAPGAAVPGQSKDPLQSKPGTAAIGGAKSAAEANNAPTPYDEMNQMYEDLLSEHENSWGATEQSIARQGAAAQRQNAVMNARTGRAVGGAFGAGMAQAMLSTNEQMLDARSRHDQQARELQLAWLDNQIKNQWRTEDMDFEREMLERKVGADKEMAAFNSPQPPKLGGASNEELFGEGTLVTNSQTKSALKEFGNKAQKLGANYSQQEMEQMLAEYAKNNNGKLPKTDAEWAQLFGYNLPDSATETSFRDGTVAYGKAGTTGWHEASK